MSSFFQGLRSPRVKMAGWVHLPRFIDKIRLNEAGRLPSDYQENFGKGFDGYWLETAGITKEAFIEVVRRSKNDAEIEEWVKSNIKKDPSAIEAYNQKVLNRGRNDDLSARLQQRKAERGFQGREDIQCFVDFIDADEGRF